MSAAGRALSKALDKPQDWRAPDRFRMIHRPSGAAFWIANGTWFFDGYEMENTPKCLGRIERHWLYRKAMKSISRSRQAKRAKEIAALCAKLDHA